jgi:hypothetical protein
MKNTEILNRINALLNRKVKLEQMTLDNGTVVEADSFTVGSPIFAINGENKDPLEVGTYTMTDGMVIEVYEVGVIGEVAMGGTPQAEVEAGKKKEVAMADVPATLEEIVQAVVDAVQPKMDELQAKIDALAGGQMAMKETLSTQKASKPLTHKPVEKVELKSKSFDPQSMIFARLANIK